MSYRNILITGATGMQGRALIRALLRSNAAASGGTPVYHILALTRDTTSQSAQELLQIEPEHRSQVQLVEGELSNADSIRKVFHDAEIGGGVWGVYVVLPYPGLGSDSNAEWLQGKILADLALEYRTKAFIYSSAVGTEAGQYGDDRVAHSFKHDVELYCERLGRRGLNWTIIRPGVFFENFDGMVGAITVTILQKGLRPDTTVAFTASEDIGKVAAGVFSNHERFAFKTLVVASEIVTISSLVNSYERARGKKMPSIPGIFGKLLLQLNAASNNFTKLLDVVHEDRASGRSPPLQPGVELSQSICHLQTYYEWLLARKPKVETKDNWNGVSPWKLLTGRS